MKKKDCIINDFENLLRRIFLDSNVLQVLQEYDEYIFDNVKIPIENKESKNIEALRNIFIINERAHFEFAISKNSMKEVLDKKDSSYLRWAYDVLDHWMCCIEEYENSKAFSGKGKRLLDKLNEKQFGYLSKKDKTLLFDAVILECDAFLTMDGLLWKNKHHLEENLNIRILQPFEYWDMLKPFAALWL